MTDRDRLLTKARKTKNIEDWNMYKRLRNKCNNKLKSAKQSFYYLGAKIYNDLPIEIRREGDYDQFLKLFKDYYK
ncbi:Hypothetical predicted protein [Paramuricea clavata]|uniref:Uncharacterized protein n=1 Tax=Paramuricea clavata TaxID=317549 RepID=A0A6S7GGD4_PARCT|nr:Hypothetical predicted protein [Paramuricea clavata]